jgi:pimeloyl-ACP methyl ester carboxylesterase
LTLHADGNRAIFDLYRLARSAARETGDTERGPEFTIEYTPGDRPVAVILLPALFVGDWLWDPVRAALAEAGWPVARFHEAASFIDRRTVRSIGRLAESLLRTVRTVTDAPLVICGDSLGAVVAIEFGRAYPDQVAGLVVSGAPGLDDTASTRVRSILAGARAPQEIADRFFALLVHDPQRLDIDPKRYVELVERLATVESGTAMVAGLQAIRGYDVRAAIRGLAMPQLLVWGSQDQITPVAPWRDLVRCLPHARLVELDECGHGPMFERPEDFYRELSLLLADSVATLPP